MEAVNIEKVGGWTETWGKQFNFFLNFKVIKGPCFQRRHIMAQSIQECYLTCTIIRKTKIRSIIELYLLIPVRRTLSKRQAVSVGKGTETKGVLIYC